ncbi:anti-sigma factor [soil metagenome]
MAATGLSDETMLQAYCDGELDPAAALAFERRLADDEALRARYREIMALRHALSALPQEDVPDRLLSRIDVVLDAERRPRQSWSRSWLSMAAAAVIGAIAATSVVLTMERDGARQQVVQQAVASHIRGLLAPQPFDIASSDRHTVKPWFTTRVAESPQVVDLAAQGFPLVGGRIDVIGREPVATIVYRRAAHVISVIAMPPGHDVPANAVAGYNVRSWRDPDFTYVAVSDIPTDELAAFERAFAAGLPR